jgi:disulfide bond formation protein DsbB
MICCLFADAKIASLVVIFASLAALATAYAAQFIGHLAPCPLCLAQRVPYALNIIVGIAALSLAAKKKPKATALILLIATLLFFAEAALAFYHAGVEHHWWESAVEGCHVTFSADNAQTMLEKIEATAPAKCDSVPWADPILHWSIAGWNLVAALVLTIYSVLSALFITRRANGL